MKKKSNALVPTSFLKKTYDMLSENSLSDIISWNPDGTEFIIYNTNEFSEKVIPLYFKHSNFASFIRQLNMYDFHKLRSGGNEHIYKHPLFIKNRPELLKEIHRKNSESNWPIVARSSFAKPEMTPVIKKLVQMHQSNINYHSQINNLEEKVQDLTKQNKLLADQLWENKDRMKNIETALLFFANCLKNTGNGEDFSRQFPAFDSMLSITSDTTYKKPKYEEVDSSPQSPLNFLGFEEDFHLSPKTKTENEFDMPPQDRNFDMELNDYNSEISVDIDKIDFLLDQ
jgi:HSF-type DNA-binding